MSTIFAKIKKDEFIATEVGDDQNHPHADFSVQELKEEVLRDNDAIYFPLDTKTEDYSNTYDAVNKSNILYDENGAFISEGSNNLWPDTSLLHGFIGDGDISNLFGSPQGKQQGIKLKKNSISDSFSTLSSGNTTSYSAGNYTISAYIRAHDSLPNTAPDNFYLAEGTGGGQITNTLIRKYPTVTPIKNQWYRIIRSADYTGSSTNMLPYIKWDDSVTFPAEYRLSGLQLENKPFATPYSSIAIGASQLTYNLHSDLSLDWDSPWTIMYWKKPAGTDNGLTGYSVESLGNTSNSVGGGYLSWGKENNNNNFYLYNGSLVSGSNSFTWESYQYNWHLIILRYNGSDTIKLDILKDAQFISFERSISIPSSNYFVNQDGYDFQLGGFNLGHQSNAYYRDLLIYKKELSDSYLTNYYNNKLKIKIVSNEAALFAGFIKEEII